MVGRCGAGGWAGDDITGEADPACAAADPHPAHCALRVAASAALGGLAIGYDISVINDVSVALQTEFAIGNLALGMAAGAALLGAAAGAMIAGRIADRIGRLAMMKLAAVGFVAGALGAGLATCVGLVIVFRVTAGLAIGFASVVSPAYIAEISPAGVRGRLASLPQLAIVSGILAALAVDFVLARAAGGAGAPLWLGLSAWRWMFLGEIIPALLFGALASRIPESPRYLVAAHRIPEARRVLVAFGERDDQAMLERIAETERRDTAPSWRDVCRPGGGLYPIVWVGLGLAVCQQFVGVNVIFFYSKMLWQAVGFPASATTGIAVITAVVNVATTVAAIALIDRVGRRRLLLAGSAGMAVTLAGMAVVFAGAPLIDGQPRLSGVAGLVALIAANGFVVAFGVSWGPVLWVLLGEMFPNRIRAAAMGLALAGQWLANWVVVATFPALRDTLGVAYGCYTLAAVFSLVLVWRWVPETAGVALEDMDTDVPHDHPHSHGVPKPP